MSSSLTRSDESHDVSYPTTPDGRGSTRLNYRRRPYYFGPHESPTSYLMFGLWKHYLLETGEAPESNTIRPLVEDLLKVKPLPTPRGKRKVCAVVLLATCGLVGLACVVTAKIVSRELPPSVDDLALSEGEINIVRGLRQQSLAKRQAVGFQEGRMISVIEELIEVEGPGNDHARHVSKPRL